MTLLLSILLLGAGLTWGAWLGFGPVCPRCGAYDDTERYHGLCLACDRAIRRQALGLTAEWRKA